MRRHGLSDRPRERIKDFLPAREGHVSAGLLRIIVCLWKRSCIVIALAFPDAICLAQRGRL
ncbi:hypothetical protein EDC15_12413 [Acetobacter aceti NBRC 14818]|nr:hypothetical protein EDC15_12413 [Acetobacter aceti NBRC 14818]